MTSGRMVVQPAQVNHEHPFTLDLRWRSGSRLRIEQVASSNAGRRLNPRMSSPLTLTSQTMGNRSRATVGALVLLARAVRRRAF